MSPILLFFFVAIIEYGYAAGAYLNANAAVADGLRVASVMGNNPTADWEIIQAVKGSVGGRENISVEKIVVFKAQNGSSTAPLACTAGTTRVTNLTTMVVNGVTLPGFGACNGYTGPLDFPEPQANAHFYGCGAPRHASADNRSRGYCPNDRNTAFVGPTNTSGPDFIGVYVRYKHELITGLFGDDITFEVTSITRVEPTEVGN